jgi:monomeric type NADP-dependent isocitrate dehydrogenase
LPNAQGKIIYTETDEAPALATYSLYPAVNRIGALALIDIIPCDISLAGRVLALFPEKLKPEQRVPNNLAYLGDLAKTPEANIIKLPNSKFMFCQKAFFWYVIIFTQHFFSLSQKFSLGPTQPVGRLHC